MSTGDVDHPRTVVFRCGTAACDALASTKSLCSGRAKAQKAGGLSMKDFKATHVPVRDRTMTDRRALCRVEDCPRESNLWGCAAHASLRNKGLDRNPSSSLDAWVAVQRA
ncbi:hypothetical protein [Streptomyces sp. NPDC058291]|uniref:hypothetical protein n=1 Tax=Streptomyces sp. NPDC058291 TaxID=3346427 RepID=UPI0036E84C37